MNKRAKWAYLHWALFDENFIEAQKFLDLGADINYVDNNGENYLMYYATRGNLESVKFLLSHNIKSDLLNKQGKNVQVLIEETKERFFELPINEKTRIEKIKNLQTISQTIKGYCEKNNRCAV